METAPELRILFFGPLPELTGCHEETRPLPDPPTVSALLDQLYEKWPALRLHDPSLRVAVNLEYTDRDATLSPGAEVALLPPVQGG